MQVRRVDHAQDAATVVEVTGDIDSYTAPQLHDELLVAHGDGARLIVVDLTSTDFLDSSALGALAGAYKAIQPGGVGLYVVCPKPHLRRIFEITRMVELFPVFDSVEAALAN